MAKAHFHVRYSWQVLHNIAHLVNECTSGIHAQQDARRQSVSVNPEANPGDEYEQIGRQISLGLLHYNMFIGNFLWDHLPALHSTRRDAWSGKWLSVGQRHQRHNAVGDSHSWGWRNGSRAVATVHWPNSLDSTEATKGALLRLSSRRIQARGNSVACPMGSWQTHRPLCNGLAHEFDGSTKLSCH